MAAAARLLCRDGKSDDHMLKVREQLAFEQKSIEEASQR